MKIARVTGIDMDFGLTLESQEEGIQFNFERRLKRLWEIGLLPSKLCQIFNITLKHLSDELDRIDVEQGGLKVDSRQQADFAIDAAKNRKRKDNTELELTIRDLQWFDSLNTPVTQDEMARYFGMQAQSLSHLKRKDKLCMAPVTTKDERSDRDSLIRRDYVTACEEGKKHGVYSRLAKKYELSRKMIDLILGDIKVVDTPKPRKINAKTTLKRQKVYQAYLDRKDSGASLNVLANELAKEFGYKGPTEIYKIVKSHDSH